jgi:hypothetical protein
MGLCPERDECTRSPRLLRMLSAFSSAPRLQTGNFVQCRREGGGTSPHEELIDIAPRLSAMAATLPSR